MLLSITFLTLLSRPRDARVVGLYDHRHLGIIDKKYSRGAEWKWLISEN